MDKFDRSFFVHHNDFFLPAPLHKGDKVMICPTSAFNSQEILGAMSALSQYGYSPQLPYSFQSEDCKEGLIPRADKILNIHCALDDPEIKAIFCIGNGHGALEILPNFSYGAIASHPKWLIGNGDATAWLAMWLLSDIVAVHGPDCSELINDPVGAATLFNLLESGGKFDYDLPSCDENRTGEASGVLIGGNLSILSKLGGSSYDLISKNRHNEDMILLLEDSCTPLWAVRDMLVCLALTGILYTVKGLIFGSFEDCKPYGDLESIQNVVQELEQRALIMPGIPIVFNFPIGKGTQNLPITEGVKVDLKVTDFSVSISTTKK